MEVTVRYENGERIPVRIQVQEHKSFSMCNEAENMQTTYAKAKDPNVNPNKKYSDKIVSAFIEKNTRIKYNISASKALNICSKLIEKFASKTYKNKQVFFIELLSCNPFEMQYHYLIED